MINFEKNRKIKVRNEEEFSTVLDDLTNQGALYLGLFLPKAKFLADDSKRTFPVYIEVSGTGKNLSFLLADPPLGVPTPISHKVWYLTLDQIESGIAPDVILDQAEWEALTKNIKARVKAKRTEMKTVTEEFGFTQQEIDVRVARNKGQMFGLKKGFDLIKNSPSGYKIDFKMDAEEVFCLLEDFHKEVGRIGEEARKLAKIKSYSEYSKEKVATRVSYLQGEMSGVQEVANLLDAYFILKLKKSKKEEGAKVEKKRTQSVRPDLKEEIDKMQGENDGAV